MEKTDGLAYELVEGRDPPLVFLHGWLGSRESWNQVRENLDLDRKMLFYDQRCHGDSRCEEFTSFRELASDLEMLLDRLELEEPVLLGHSMGGMVAANYAATRDNLSGLILFGSCASTPEPRNKPFDFFLDSFDSMTRSEWADLVVENTARGATGELQEIAKDEIMEADRKVLLYPLKAMQNFDVREDLEEYRKARVVAARHDGSVTASKTRELAQILGVQHQIIDSSHLMPWERPGKLAEIIEDFIETEVK